MPAALIVAVLKSIVQIFTRSAVFKIRFDCKTEKQKEPSGYFLTECFCLQLSTSSMRLACPDGMGISGNAVRDPEPTAPCGRLLLAMGLMTCSVWKLQEGKMLPYFPFLVSGSF